MGGVPVPCCRLGTGGPPRAQGQPSIPAAWHPAGLWEQWGLAELLPESRGRMLWYGEPCAGAGWRQEPAPAWVRAPQGEFTRALAGLMRCKQAPKLAGRCLEQGAGAGEGCLQSGRQVPSPLCQRVG